MSPDKIDILRTMYRDYYHPSIDDLPDSWFEIIQDFLYDLGV